MCGRPAIGVETKQSAPPSQPDVNEFTMLKQDEYEREFLFFPVSWAAQKTRSAQAAGGLKWTLASERVDETLGPDRYGNEKMRNCMRTIHDFLSVLCAILH